MSTVGDLYIWNRAIRNNKLITKESKALAFTSAKLNNGELTNYGYAWGISEINGSPTIEHSGSIFGYVTNAIYLPTEDVFVAIFSNNGAKVPYTISTKMAAIAIGKPFPDIKDAIPVKSEELKKFVGVYDFADSSSRIITLVDNQLYSRRPESTKFKLIAFKKNTFTYEGDFANIEFVVNGEEIKAFFTSRIHKTTGVKTDKAISTNKEIKLETKVLEQYLGVYEIQPGFDITVTLDGNKLMTQATGQQKSQIFPESQTKFFLKVVDAKIEFVANDKGLFDSFVLYQGGQEVPGKKKD